MKRVSPYLKMRVLGAIEFAPGSSIASRIKQVAQTRFLDEDGHHRRHRIAQRSQRVHHQEE